ncbi:hypothetical protein Tco_1005908 [Tanacetum coccineum]|uniref:Uncharacterized protein n=1 Tax=Tanacetum coccineum TaxID=301880 RepID=A0ABQ5FGC1_9ASTR
MVGQIIQKKEEEKRIAEEQAAKDRYWKIPICYDDDEDYTIAITPVSSTKEPINSLIVENLVLIPSEAEVFPTVCVTCSCNNPTSLEAFKEHSETIIDSNHDYSSSDDDSFSSKDIEYVDASPPDAKIVSLEVVEIVIPKNDTRSHISPSEYDSFSALRLSRAGQSYFGYGGDILPQENQEFSAYDCPDLKPLVSLFYTSITRASTSLLHWEI